MMKKYLIFLLLLLLLSFSCGCMPGGDLSLGDLIGLFRNTTDPNQEGQQVAETGSSPTNGSGDFASDNFYTLASFKDFVDNFSSYEYQHSLSHPKIRFNDIVKLNYLGTENIDGVMADKVQVTVNTESYEDRGQQGVLELKRDHIYDLWLGQDGLLLQVVRDGVMMTSDADIAMAGSSAVHSVIGPQAMILLQYHLQLISEHHRESTGWQLVNRTKINREIGAGQINVDVFDFQSTEGKRKYFEIANINGINVYIGIYEETEVDLHDGLEDSGLRQYQVTRLIPR